jgi:hypothetical protein
MPKMTEQELRDKIIAQSEEIDRLEELAAYREPHQRERDEAREGWEYARLTSQQWQTAYNELLTKSQVHIESATGTNFDVRTLEPREATPIFCDHSRWQEAERTLEAIRALPILYYTAVYDLADDLRSILFPAGGGEGSEPPEFTDPETPENAETREFNWIDTFETPNPLRHISESEKRQKEPGMGVSVDAKVRTYTSDCPLCEWKSRKFKKQSLASMAYLQHRQEHGMGGF